MKKLLLFLYVLVCTTSTICCMQTQYPKLVYIGFPAKIISEGKLSDFLEKIQKETDSHLQENMAGLENLSKDFLKPYKSITKDNFHIVLTVPIVVYKPTQLNTIKSLLERKCTELKVFKITSDSIEPLYAASYIGLTFTIPIEIIQRLIPDLKASVAACKLRWPQELPLPHCKLAQKKPAFDISKIKAKQKKSSTILQKVLLKLYEEKVIKVFSPIERNLSNFDAIRPKPISIKITQLFLMEATGEGSFRKLANFPLEG